MTKKQSVIKAKQSLIDRQMFVKYTQARKHATVYEFALDKDSLGELVVLLQQFNRISETVHTIPGMNIKNMLQIQYSKLPKLIQSMIQIWGIKELIKRCEHAIKIDAHRPRDIPILDIVASPDLYDIEGDFSSFDPNLTKKQMQHKTNQQKKEYMNANIPTCEAVTAQITNAMLRVLNKNIDARKDLIIKGDRLTYSLYFHKITDDMMKELDLHGTTPWVTFIDSQEILTNAPENLLGLSGGTKEPYIVINLKNLKEKNQHEHDAILRGLFVFFDACETFAHEFTHYIDRQFPNRGALGAQKAILSDKIYDGNATEHDNNPNEKTPLLVGTAVKQQLIINTFARHN